MEMKNEVNDDGDKYPGAVGVYGLVYNMVQLLRATPTCYGFSNVSWACCGDGTLGGLVQCGKEGYKMLDKSKILNSAFSFDGCYLKAEMALFKAILCF
ncbi:hypothetical protein LguiB_013573 [Lonicera macranthoides]